MKIGEVSIMTRDVIRLANFYKALLNVDNHSNDPVHQFILSGETALTVYNDGSSAMLQNTAVSLAFTVDDVDTQYRRLLDMGVTVLEKPTTRPWGARNMHFLDPDGNHLYFRTLPPQ